MKGLIFLKVDHPNYCSPSLYNLMSLFPTHLFLLQIALNVTLLVFSFFAFSHKILGFCCDPSVTPILTRGWDSSLTQILSRSRDPSLIKFVGFCCDPSVTQVISCSRDQSISQILWTCFETGFQNLGKTVDELEIKGIIKATQITTRL